LRHLQVPTTSSFREKKGNAQEMNNAHLIYAAAGW
jgi:hypothetical protein